MATQQKPLGNFEAGLVSIYLEYDDTTMRALGVRVINNGASSVYVALIRSNDRELYSQTFPAGETYLSLPQTGQTRLTLELDARGRFSNIEIQMGYPA